ncbi:MAG: PP2C family protein-serine/threonine phosphatase [Actinomycetota bacterium]
MRLSLRRKIVGGFGLLLLLIALLGWVTLSLFSSLRSVQSKVFNEAIPGLVAVNEIVRSYSAQSAAIRGYLINSEVQLLKQYEFEVEEARFWEESAMDLFRSGEEREQLDTLVAGGDEFHRLVDEEVIPLAREGRRSLAFSRLGEKGRSAFATIEITGDRLRNLQAGVVSESQSNLSRRSTQAIVTLFVVIFGALGLGVVVAVILPRRLEANISRLVEAVRAIGRGDFNQRVEIHSGDEVEELAVRFGEMQAGLKRLQQLVAQDRELEIAASIQQNLLQHSMPQSPGLELIPIQRQANLVGGDWYDVDGSGGSVSVVVGDASGKGIGAALIATVTLSVLRGERRLGATPGRIITRANEALREATDSDSFTTLVYATIEPQSGEVRWLNMGHPAPFLLRTSDGDGPARGYFVEGPRNRALGWFEDPGLAETVIRLEPGDRLVLFTDGFLEAKAADGSIFGEERLAQQLLHGAPLSSAALGDELVRGVERFAAGKLEDDLTMLIVEFHGEPLGERVSRRLTGDEPWHSRR